MKCDKSFLRSKMVAWRMAFLVDDIERMDSIAAAVLQHGFAEATVDKWLKDNRRWAIAQATK